MANVEPDKIEKLPCGSLMQHGPFNDRIYLMKLSDTFSKKLPQELIAKAEQNNYSKIFTKVKTPYRVFFEEAGYSQEASIPGLYNGQTSGVFMAFYLDQARACEGEAKLLDEIGDLALSKATSVLPKLNDVRFNLRPCIEDDTLEMANLYKTVFPSYPFPIDDAQYLVETMRSHVDYFGIEVDGNLIALASSEKDRDASNVEMTDFATIPEWRGHQLGRHLLKTMETAMQQQGIKTAYTIARAYSHGMNIIFSKSGYQYGGRLKNNTNIFGKLESMNIWYKAL